MQLQEPIKNAWFDKTLLKKNIVLSRHAMHFKNYVARCLGCFVFKHISHVGLLDSEELKSQSPMTFKCLHIKHNTMSPTSAQTWTAWSRVETTNHKATVRPRQAIWAIQHTYYSPIIFAFSENWLHSCSSRFPAFQECFHLAPSEVFITCTTILHP